MKLYQKCSKKFNYKTFSIKNTWLLGHIGFDLWFFFIESSTLTKYHNQLLLVCLNQSLESESIKTSFYTFRQWSLPKVCYTLHVISIITRFVSPSLVIFWIGVGSAFWSSCAKPLKWTCTHLHIESKLLSIQLRNFVFFHETKHILGNKQYYR